MISKQIISLEGRGRMIDDESRLERLLSGMITNDQFKNEVATIQLFPHHTWESVTALLTSYDKRDKDAKEKVSAESANLAESAIICHGCGESGHKRPNCPNRVKPPRAGKGGKGNGGRGGKGGGGRGGKGAGGRGGGGKSKNIECNICGKRGHYACDCHSAQAFREFLKKKRKSKKQKNRDYDSESESSNMVQEDVALTSHDMTRSGVLDSGCSSHTVDQRAIPNGVHIDGARSSTIKTARQGETLSAVGRANAGLLQKTLVLKPKDLNENLISLPRLDNSGHVTVLGNGEGLVYKDAKITITGGKLVARAPLNPATNLYQLDNIQTLMSASQVEDQALLGSAPIKEDIHLWHKRLGHRSKRAIIKYRNMGRIRGISKHVKLTKKDQAICDSCARAKSTRHSFKKRKIFQSESSTTKDGQFENDTKRSKTEELIDDHSDSEDSDSNDDSLSAVQILSESKPLRSTIPKICTDIKGPFSVEGTRGERFYQGFIEEDTKFITAYFSVYKSDALGHTEFHWKNVLQAEGQTATTYQADGAPELISKDIVKLLSSVSTKTMWSPPYTAELNSIIERNHRTVFESGHAMLLESNLPTLFWCEAIRYACIIFNSLPTQTAYGIMSPIEAKYGVVPDVRRFRTFGCVCYIHVPKERRAKGFIEKAYRAYFLGFDVKQKAYKAWIIDLNEAVTTAHLAFDEITQIQKQVNATILEYAPESKNVKDFKYLEGLLYRDDEDELLYVSTRVVV